MWQSSKANRPVPSSRGLQPTSEPVLGSRVHRRSVGPSSKSKGTALLPMGLAGFSGWFAFSSSPTPSSKRVMAKVFPLVATGNPKRSVPPQSSNPNSGTLIHRILKVFTPVNPITCNGKDRSLTDLAAVFRSAHAGAIRGAPALSSGTVGVLSLSPTPKVILPFEFKKNPFQTQPAVPTGPPNTNSNPPLRGPKTGGGPAPSSSSPRKIGRAAWWE